MHLYKLSYYNLTMVVDFVLIMIWRDLEWCTGCLALNVFVLAMYWTASYKLFELHTISAVPFHDILWLFTFQLILYHIYKKLFTIINLYFVLIWILTIQICKYIYVIAGASFNVFFYFFRYSAFMYCISVSVLVAITLIRVVSSVPKLKLEIWSIWKRTE